MERIRSVIFYKRYFLEFYTTLPKEARKKINYSLYMIETQLMVPEKFFKSIKTELGLYEIRASMGNNQYRIFCCLDDDSIVVLFHGFHKKTQKTPTSEIRKARQLMKEYYQTKKTTL